MVMLDPTQPQKKPLQGQLDPNTVQAPPAGWKPAAPVDPGMNISAMATNMQPPPINTLAGSAPAPPAAAQAPAAEMTPQQANAAGLGWVDKNNPNYGKAGFVGSQPSAPAAPGAPAPTADPATGPATAGAPAAATPDTAFKDALMKLLNPGEVSADSASIKPAIDANRLAEQRSFESNRNLLAERAAANGTNNSGGFETGLTGLAQDRAQREGEFAGNAVTHAKDQQTASLLAALGIGGNYSSANADRAMKGEQFGKSLEEQKREADTDAEMKRLGITSQADLGNKDLSLRDKLGSGQLNLGLSQLLSGNNNFKDNLGATLGMHNQDAILRLLGMA